MAPLRPQKVQCLRSPHQQPRDVSKKRPAAQPGRSGSPRTGRRNRRNPGTAARPCRVTGGARRERPEAERRRVGAGRVDARDVPTRCGRREHAPQSSGETQLALTRHDGIDERELANRLGAHDALRSSRRPSRSNDVRAGRALTRLASASDARCCWKTLVKPTTLGRAATISSRHSSRKASTTERARRMRRTCASVTGVAEPRAVEGAGLRRTSAT